MHALDQVHVFGTDQNVIIVDEGAGVAVPVVHLAGQQVLPQPLLVPLCFYLARLVELLDAADHFGRVVVAISAQETSSRRAAI